LKPVSVGTAGQLWFGGAKAVARPCWMNIAVPPSSVTATMTTVNLFTMAAPYPTPSGAFDPLPAEVRSEVRLAGGGAGCLRGGCL
jgi:hypothetical protein